MRVAAIDVGTNTTRLLVAETTSNFVGYRELDRKLTFTRLGEGVDSDQLIKPEAMKRTLDAISAYCAEAGELSVGAIKVATTSAVRDAKNRDDFVGAVAKITGVKPEIVKGEREGRLSFDGAVADLEPGEYLVCDIGGGSTEFFFGSTRDKADAPRTISLDIGSVRLTERILKSDPPKPEELTHLEATIDKSLARVDRAIPNAADGSFVGVAGTITSLAALQLELKKYDPAKTHHFRLGVKHVEELYSRLMSMPVKERERMPALPPGRADVIVAGTAILLMSMRKWSFDQVIVSEHDILDGMVLELIAESKRAS
jgi:exopolyphosphatase/guanosine-5'-triphosphate,3'-diphosphate pyrophosphatase